MPKMLMMLLGLCFSVQVQAFPCFLTLVKDSCWTNYNLMVSVINGNTGKLVTAASVPQGTSWARQPFDCQPAEGLSFTATFTPAFWESDSGKIYAAKHDWFLPKAIVKGDTAWNITMCYPRDFSEVPLPPDAGGNCKCNTDIIPPIKPQ